MAVAEMFVDFSCMPLEAIFFWSGKRPAEFDSDLAVFFGRSWGGHIPTQGTIREKLAGYPVFLSWILKASVVPVVHPLELNMGPKNDGVQ